MTSVLQQALQDWLPGLHRIANGQLDDVGTTLGRHDRGRQSLVLTQIGGDAVEVRLEGRRRMVRCPGTDVFAWLGDRSTLPAHYRLDWTDRYGARHHRCDPYSFGAGLTSTSLHHLQDGDPAIAALLGVEAECRDGVTGCRFAVWVPTVTGVYLTLPGGALPLIRHSDTGLWSLFVPDVPVGTPYGFEIVQPDGTRVWHTDPCGRTFEPRPGWRARVPSPMHHPFDDDAWIAARATRSRDAPLSIYELHLGSFLRRPAEAASYAALAERIVRHVVPMGFTHVELLPVTEHPFEGSWGYQVTGYHAPTIRHGTPDDFRGLVDRLHRAGLGVVLDWVPGHFASDAPALADFNGAPLYEYADPTLGQHHGWGTRVFDLTRPEVRAFLIASALRFLREFHVDGLRIDAVAAMLYRDYDRPHGAWAPNAQGGPEHLEGIAFLRALTSTIRREFPGVLLIAEDSSLFPGVTAPVTAGGLGFDYKWNLGWMHDSLAYFREDPLYRRHHHRRLPDVVDYSRAERGLLALSHDEVVHGKRSILAKMPGDPWQQLANVRLLLAWQWLHPGAKLLFMGTEFATPDEWNHQNALPWELESTPAAQALIRLISDLNALYRSCPALWGDGTTSTDLRFISTSDDLRSVLVFERRLGDDRVVVALNATPVPREGYVIGLPIAGLWQERLNTDSLHYGGSDVGNWGAIEALADPALGEPYSARVRLPPLAVAVFARPRLAAVQS